MNYMNRITAFIILCIFTASATCAEEAKPRQRRPFLNYWLAVYSGVHQVGCMQTTLSCDTLNGEEVFKREDNVYLRAKDSDMTAHLEISGVIYTTRRFRPILDRFTFITKSVVSGETHEQQGTMEMDYVNNTQKMVQTSGGETKEETTRVDLKASDLDYSAEFCARPLKVGDKLSYNTSKFPAAAAAYGGQVRFERSTSEVRVLRREKVEVNNITYDALVLQDKSDLGEATRWQLDNGTIIKESIPYSGVTLKAITEKEARNWLEEGGLNFSTLFDRIETDKKIAYITSVTNLDVRLLGVWDAALVTSDNRQKAKYDPKTKVAEYSITAGVFDLKHSISLPVTEPGMQAWLQQSDGLEVGDETINKLAGEIVGGEKNAYFAASKIRQWVNKNIKYVDGAKTPISALATLQEKQGVCCHMALLYTALARAAGIPTYLVVGPSYFTDFFGWHAWAESYVGEWVAFDPTRDTDFVDAGHIKMFTGNKEIMSDYSVARGQMRAEVLRFKHYTPGDGKQLYWINDKDQWWQFPIDEVYIIYPDGNIAHSNTNIADLINKEFKVTDGIRAQAPNGETIILPQESKVLPRGSAYKTPDGFTLQSSDCIIIHAPNGVTVLIPPGGKVLGSDS